MDKQSTIRTIRASFKIDQVENGWTVATSDGNTSRMNLERYLTIPAYSPRAPAVMAKLWGILRDQLRQIGGKAAKPARNRVI